MGKIIKIEVYKKKKELLRYMDRNVAQESFDPQVNTFAPSDLDLLSNSCKFKIVGIYNLYKTNPILTIFHEYEKLHLIDNVCHNRKVWIEKLLTKDYLKLILATIKEDVRYLEQIIRIESMEHQNYQKINHMLRQFKSSQILFSRLEEEKEEEEDKGFDNF